MRANLEATGGFVLSEAVMLALAARIGKQSAHTLVYETAMNAHITGRGLKEAILDNPQICAYLSTSEIEALFDYRHHTGQCCTMVDQVLAELGNNDEHG
jgi:adenylosuccinate lyase